MGRRLFVGTMLWILPLVPFPLPRWLAQLFALLLDPLPGQSVGVRIGTLGVRFRCVDFSVLKSLLVGASFAVASDNLPLLVAVLPLALVPFLLRREPFRLAVAVVVFAPVQRSVWLLVVAGRWVGQLLELRLHCAVAALVRLFLPAHVAQPSAVGVDQVLAPAFHVLAQLRALDDPLWVLLPLLLPPGVGAPCVAGVDKVVAPPT